MKKITLRILCLILLISVLCHPLSVQAASVNSFLTFTEVIQKEEQYDLIAYSKLLPEGGELTVSIDSQQIESPVLSTVRQEMLPVTVYCLVDITKDMNAQQVQQQQDILNIISSRMGEGDSMVISTVGSKTVKGAVLSTLEARKTAISTLEREGTAPDMFQAITDAMAMLNDESAFNTNRCLLILSDGVLTEKSETTEAKALAAVSSSTIPVYAIGITGKYNSDYAVNNAKRMLQFADESIGGLGIIPAVEKISAADAAQQIWENIQNSNIIKINLSQVTAAGTSATLFAQYELEDMLLKDNVIVTLPVGKTSIDDPEQNPNPEWYEVALDWIKANAVIVCVCVGAGVLLIVVLVVFSGKKKKTAKAKLEEERRKREQAEAEVQTGQIIGQESVTSSGVDTIMSTGEFEERKQSSFRTQAVSGAYPQTTFSNQDTGVMVQLQIVTHQNVVVGFPIKVNMPQVLGRDDRASVIINGEDYQLSGRHCEVEWDGNNLYVRDLNSTNGTVLNGMRLKPDAWNLLSNGSVIHMGSFDYRVMILR